MFHQELDALIPANAKIRKINELIDFQELTFTFSYLTKSLGRQEYGIEIGLRCLFLQYYFDLSDREMEDTLARDMHMRWFCGFNLKEKTPSYVFFYRFRSILGARGVRKIFQSVLNKARGDGILRNVFMFADSALITRKESLWKERDQALAEALNNNS